MHNFIQHFGKFFWIWQAFGIYLILTGIIWMFFIFYKEPVKAEENKVEGENDEQQD